MSHFLYISDVFCPWCYGFAPVMQRISSEHPGYPVRVLSGDLVENPTTTGEMMRNHPTMREFFVRLAKTTGQAVGQDFLRRLEPGQGDLRMFSPDMAVPLAALKKLAPGHELEQMEAFQSAFYGEGRDVLAPEVQMRIANVDGDVFMRALEDPGVQAAAEAEREEALDILGDFVVYPTLFLETDDGERHVLARGYADYPVVAAKKLPPRPPPAKTSIRGEAAQQESVPVKGKTSYPMCKPFPAVPPNQKPAQHVRAGFIFVYPKV